MNRLRLGGIGLAVAAVLAGTGPAEAANGRLKANNLTDLNLAGSWNGSVLPTPTTLVQWNNTDTQSGSLLLGADLSWMGIQIIDPANAVVINGGTGNNTLTLGRAGIIMSSATVDLTINSNLALLANTNEIWSVATGRTLTINSTTFTRQAGASLNINLAGTGSVAVASSVANDSTGILGTWATIGTGTSTTYATVSGGKIASYAGTSVTTATANDTTGTANYTVSAVGALAANASFNSLRYTGAAGTITGDFQANGLLNAGGALVLTGNATIGASRELVVNASGAAVTMSGVISDNAGGASALTKTGVNALTLSNSNTYTGVTTISAGSVVLSNSNGLGSTVGETIVIGQDSANTGVTPNVPAIPGGLLRLTNNINVAERLTLQGLGNNSGFLVNNDSGNNTLSGLVTFAGTEAVRIGVTSGSQLTMSGGISGTSSFFVLNPSANSTLAFTTNPVNMGSAGKFYQDTPGIVAVGVNGNTWGTTTIANGTMRMDIANAIPLISVVSLGLSYAPGGTWDLNGFDQSVSSFSSGTSIPGARVLTSSGGTTAHLTITQAAAQSYNGLISGNLALTKSGTATLTLLNGDNTYTGDTVISQGTMVVNNYAASPTQNGTVAVTSGVTTVTVANATGLVAGQAVTGTGIPANSYISGIAGNVLTITTPTAATAGSITDLNIGALVGSLKGSTLNYAGQGGTLSFGVSTTSYTLGGLKGTQNLSLINTGSAAVALSIGANGQSTVYTGVLSGAGASVNKIGAGSLELGGANTYTGATTVSAGKLIVSGSLSNSSAVSVAAGSAGATLASGHDTTSAVGAVTVASDANGGGTLAPGDTGGATATTIGKLTVNGTLSLGTSSTATQAHLALELGGTTAGTLYDQVATTGNVSLNNVNLDLSLVNGFAGNIQLTDVFIVILNGGAGAVTGAFANAPGNQITWGDYTFNVNYAYNADGTANDVALTVAAVPEPGVCSALLLGAGSLLGLRRLRRRTK